MPSQIHPVRIARCGMLVLGSAAHLSSAATVPDGASARLTGGVTGRCRPWTVEWKVSGEHEGGQVMATTKALEQAEIDRLEAQVTASQRMASEEETDADRALGRKVLTGEMSADDAIAVRLAQIDAKHGITR